MDFRMSGARMSGGLWQPVAACGSGAGSPLETFQAGRQAGRRGGGRKEGGWRRKQEVGGRREQEVGGRREEGAGGRREEGGGSKVGVGRTSDTLELRELGGFHKVHALAFKFPQ